MFSRKYGQLFRRLLHIFERSYARGVLTGDPDKIRPPLHESLEAAHEGETCEVEECPWIYHECPGTWDSYCAECPLLVAEEDISQGSTSSLSSAYADDDDSETSTPVSPIEPDARSLQSSDSGALVIAQSTVQLKRPLHSSSTSSIHDVPKNPTVSMEPARVEASASLIHQTASSASSEAAFQPQITPNTFLSSHLASIAVQDSPLVRLLLGQEGKPSNPNQAKSTNGEAWDPPSGRVSPRGVRVAVRQASSVSAAAETPGHRDGILSETDARVMSDDGAMHRSSPSQQSYHPHAASLHEGSLHSAGPTSTGTTTPGQQVAVSEGRPDSNSLHGLPEDAGAHRGERGIGAQQVGERSTPGPAAVLFQGDTTADGRGAEEFELATRDFSGVPREGSGCF